MAEPMNKEPSNALLSIGRRLCYAPEVRQLVQGISSYDDNRDRNGTAERVYLGTQISVAFQEFLIVSKGLSYAFLARARPRGARGTCEATFYVVLKWLCQTWRKVYASIYIEISVGFSWFATACFPMHWVCAQRKQMP
ncbi:MAG: hypothetical protein J6O18_09070 [Bacilli bacterium]|nr:hypothetical protein [Bacilli bacterium]